MRKQFGHYKLLLLRLDHHFESTDLKQSSNEDKFIHLILLCKFLFSDLEGYSLLWISQCSYFSLDYKGDDNLKIHIFISQIYDHFEQKHCN